MERETIAAAGLILLAVILMVAARSLYPEVPSIESEIRVERPLNESAREKPVEPQPTETPIENATTTETPTSPPMTTQPPMENESKPGTNVTQTQGGQAKTTATPTTGEGLELGVSFYNSVLSVIRLEESETSIRGVVGEAYEASVEGVCENCVAVILLSMGGDDIAVVLVNKWKIENSGERIMDSIALAKELIGENVRVKAVKIGSKINGIEAFAAIEIKWKGYEAELLKGEYGED